MSKAKITCFRYRRYNDIYVCNVAFSVDELLEILDVFQIDKIAVLIEGDENYIAKLSSIGKNVEVEEVSHCPDASSFIVICNKTELLCIFKQANIEGNIEGFDGLFIASINNDIISKEFLSSLEYIPNSMVKGGISDVSISVDFPENEMVISFIKKKYEVRSINDKITSIFRGRTARKTQHGWGKSIR